MKVEFIGERSIKLLEDVTYKEIVTPEGFEFDGASIPRYLWTFVGSPYVGHYRRASCLHDWMYMTRLYDRKKCDRLFNDIMKEDGVSDLKRYIMYYSVRLFGDSHYCKLDKDTVNKLRELGNLSPI
jgi:hypothetical protein